MSLNKVKLNIAGSSYVISTLDEEQSVLELAQQLDEDMVNIMENNQSASTTAAAVLCAMTYLDKLDKANKGSDNMRMQIKQYLEEANRAKYEAEKVKIELEKLKVEIQYIKNQRGSNER